MVSQSKNSRDDDLDLVQRAMRHEPAAVEAFLGRLKCVPRMIAYKNARLGSPLGRQELEDVAQETVLAIWRRLERFTGQGPLEPWIYRFCFLELMARLRSLGRRPQLLGDAMEAVSGSTLPKDPSPYEDVYKSLDAIGPPGADVVRLKHFEKLTFDEIAERMGISSNTAKTWYYRTLPKLRERLRHTLELEPRGGES